MTPMTDIAKEYGAALFMLAKEDGNLDAVIKSLALVETAFQDNPDYELLLSLPNVAREERVALLDAAFANTIEETVLSFLKLMCEEGYIRAFATAKAEFDALVDDDNRLSHAVVTSAVPLTDSEKAALIAKLERQSGRHVEAEYRLDEALLGGIVVELNGTVYDNSLKRQMTRIKEVIEA